MLRTICGDPERYVKTVLERDSGRLLHRRRRRANDKDGYFWMMGRVDDVLNVSGHRLGTMEIESRAGGAPQGGRGRGGGTARRAEGTGRRRLRDSRSRATRLRPQLKEELRQWVAKEIGSMAKPDDIRFTEPFPRRAGKIMRRLLRELATHGEVMGDTTTLEDFSVIARLRQQDED